jgi:Na+-translocating ferredoxin:NAD+ oxidoreductase RNF subunit RnfB
MRVWIDQYCCTGAGLCVDHCPGECISLGADSPQIDTADDSDIVDAEIVDS